MNNINHKCTPHNYSTHV